MTVKPTTKYEANSGLIHKLVMDADRLAAAGAPPTGEVSSRIRAKISKSNREYGIRPRGVTIARTIGTAPETFKKYSFLPVLTQTAFDGTGFVENATVTIGSVDWTVVTKVPEDY